MSNAAYGDAFKLYTLGYRVIPSGGGEQGKSPLVKWAEYQVRQPDEEELLSWQSARLWGITTGTDVTVFDADNSDMIALFDKAGLKPHVKTPRGQHYWFKYIPNAITKAAYLPGLDVRNDGGFANVTGNRKDGGIYQLVIIPTPDTLYEYKQLPEQVRQAIESTSKKNPMPVISTGEPIPIGQQDSFLASQAGVYRRRGDSEASIAQKLWIDVQERFKEQDTRDPYTLADCQRVAHSIFKYQDTKEYTPGTPGGNGHKPKYNQTDPGNAEYFVELYGQQLRFDHRRNRWLEWHAPTWREDADGQIIRLGIKAIRDRYQKAINIDDQDERKKEAEHAIKSEQRTKLEAFIEIAKHLIPIADSGENWDADPWLLAVKNGVINLRTGELREGRPQDRITQQSPVTYSSGAKAPRFLQFIDEIFGNDTELISWIQRFYGYCLTGDTKEQVIAIGYGKGSNGKGVLTSILRHVLGSYAYDAPFSTFELYQRAAIPNDLAALVGRRFVTSSETNEGTRLNEARIKALSGQDPVTARFLHAEYFTFQPVAKFFLAVNHRPRVADDSYGFWRRVRLIPFNNQFTGEQVDKTLFDKLVTEAGGVLNWLIEGCLLWQKYGLDKVPESISAATREYRTESDPLSQFILERCVINPQYTIQAKALYTAYTQWSTDQGMRERELLTNNAFGRRMGEKFKKSHERAGTVYSGLALAVTDCVTEFDSSVNPNSVFPIENPSYGKLSEVSVTIRQTVTNPSPDEVIKLWEKLGKPIVKTRDGTINGLDEHIKLCGLTDAALTWYHENRVDVVDEDYGFWGKQ